MLACATSDGRIKFWALFIAFVAIYLLSRLPWITCDPGVASIWEYGYNATDEGYYLAGGKEKYLWGFFVDLPRNEAFTYGFSAGTHWLSYIAHLLFGLSTWAWRLPFLVIYLCAWLAMFCHVAKRTGPDASFAVCTSTSLIPMVVAYERTASNDALIGALLVLSYVCASGRTRLRKVLAGALAGTIVLVKPSVWVLLPVVAAGVVQERELRSCLKDVAVFAVAAVVSVVICKLFVALSVMPDASRAGVSVWEVVRKTTTHYPLPSLFDFASHFKGLSSFPRDPSIQLLGPVAPMISVIPFAMAVRNVVSRRWNGHLLLFAALPAYVAAVSVMNTIYTHYFIPVVMMLPILFSAGVSEAESGGAGNAADWKPAAWTSLVIAAACGIGALFLASYSIAPTEAQNFYSRIYNFPARNVWCATWPAMLFFAVAVSAALTFLNGLKVAKWHSAIWFAVALVAGSVVFAPIPAFQIAPYVKRPSSEYFAPMVVSLVTASLFIVAVFDMKGRFRRRAFAICAISVCLLASYAAIPTWRTAFHELAGPGTHFHAETARELEKILPKDAVVIGERSNQMLMSLPVRTATTFVANSDPIPVIESILKADPNAKLYALADSQHAYNLQHYREHANEYRLRHMKTFKMPSFGNGSPADVYLCALLPVRR